MDNSDGGEIMITVPLVFFYCSSKLEQKNKKHNPKVGKC